MGELPYKASPIEESGLFDADAKIEKEEVVTEQNKKEELPLNAVYESKDKNVTFSYASGEYGLKESIILHEPPENNVFEYKLDIGALAIRENVDNEGMVLYDDETETAVAAISPPWMNDASGDAYSEAITYDLKETTSKEGEYILVMTVDESYLNDEARKYPVTIDPTLTWNTSGQVDDVYVLSGEYSDMNFYDAGAAIMPVGENSEGTYETHPVHKSADSRVRERDFKCRVDSV